MDDSSGLIRLGSAVVGGMIVIGAISWTVDAMGGRGNRGRIAAGVAPVHTDSAPPGVCEHPDSMHALPDAVHEASGVALSRNAPDILWVHSDAGGPRVVAVTPQGEVRGTVRVAGASAENWEDLASGPCAEGSCLFVADIGDQDATRARVTVYRVPEPDARDGTSAPAQALHARYPDGAHEAEAIFLDAAGRIHLVTKGETGPVAVYRFPTAPRAGEVSVLERVRALTSGQVGRRQRITGAGASPDGRWVALRSLESVSIYPMAALTGGAAARPTVFDVKALGEAQGEGVAMGPAGAVYLVSEGGGKRDPATLTRLECPLPG